MRHKKAVQITLDGFYYMDYKLISSLQKPCHHSIIDIFMITHCKRCCCIHNSDSMFKTIFFQLFFQLFSNVNESFFHNRVLSPLWLLFTPHRHFDKCR